jgi:hypothetical protein
VAANAANTHGRACLPVHTAHELPC